MSATVLAEIYFDDESRNWHFHVPVLHVVGGGTATRKEAEDACVEAIEFALTHDVDQLDPARATAFTVSIGPAA